MVKVVQIVKLTTQSMVRFEHLTSIAIDKGEPTCWGLDPGSLHGKSLSFGILVEQLSKKT